MDLKFRWANKSDILKILEFLEENFGKHSIQAEPARFEALFVDHPGGFQVSLCFDGEKIVGVRCYMPVRIRYSDKIIETAFPADTMVNKEYRRCGIGHQFLEMAFERFSVNISNGQSPANASLYKKLGASIVSGFQKGYLVRRPEFRGVGLKPAIRDIISWAWGLSKKGPCNKNVDVLTLEEASKILPTLSSRLLPEEVGTLNDQNWFLWRYAGSFFRGYNSAKLIINNDNCICVYKSDGNKSSINDLYCNANDIENALKSIVRFIPGNRIETIFTGHRLANAFKRAGFFLRPVEANLVILAADRQLQSELSRREWMMFSGDADTDLRDLTI